MTTEARRRALVVALPDDAEALLVTKLVNVRYLSGFTGSSAALLVLRDGAAVLATDGRYEEQARVEAPDLPVIVTRAPARALVAEATSRRQRGVAIERHHLTLAAHDALTAVAAGILFVDAGLPVERLRTQKDAQEIALLRRACEITDTAFTNVLDRLRPGVTERDLAWKLLAEMRGLGADGEAFESIVAFGPHSAIPHHHPTERPLARGDLVKLDFGALVEGYRADMTRTVVCGVASDWQRDLHARVLDVQTHCRTATVCGASPLELDTLARRLIEDSGHRFVHGLGHGVGLEIHEKPFLVPGSDDTSLSADSAVTVEPGIYLPGRGGVRIEDTVLVTQAAPEALTSSPRELLEI